MSSPPRIAPLDQAIIDRVVGLTDIDPPHEATHWTAGAMAAAVGVSVSSVQRIWRVHQLRPHRFRAFKLSNDPAFADKVQDVVGLDVDPPAHAVVVSIDECPHGTRSGESQIQALDRTRPGLPIKPGRLGTMTHDSKRHEMTPLFAALDVLDGKVIGRNMQRHRHQEFVRFLGAVERAVARQDRPRHRRQLRPPNWRPKVRAWLGRHPRWTSHFTPTSCSWLGAVEGFFAKLARRRLERGVFRAVADLQAAIARFIEEADDAPRPFVWTADPNRILSAANRAQQALDSIHWPHMPAYDIEATGDDEGLPKELQNGHASVRSPPSHRH